MIDATLPQRPDLQRGQTRRLARTVLAYTAGFGALVLGWLALVGRHEAAGGWLVCALPALAAAWAMLSGLAPPRNAIARLLAVGLFAPLLLLFWAGEQTPDTVPGWPFFVPVALLHAAAFVGAIVWMGRTMTRVEPLAGVTPVSAAALRRRLTSFAGGEPSRCGLHTLPSGTLVVELLRSSAGERHHRVLLDLQPAACEVRVREQLGAWGDAPADGDEASMRGPGDDAVAPGRPQAERVWAAVRQTTMLEPEQLAAVPLVFEGDEVRYDAMPRRGEGVLLALCAVVIRSGWAWQPAWREPPDGDATA